MTASVRIGVIGAGIVGLAAAREILARIPDAQVAVFEKENRVAAHQSGRNSGVLHAGLYYDSGSLKARLCRQGAELMRQFCAEHDIDVRMRGKLVVASESSQLPDLDRIEERARANRVPGVQRLDRAGMAEIEPDIIGAAALHSPTTAVVDFAAVAAAMAADIELAGGEIRFSTPVIGVVNGGWTAQVRVAGGVRPFDHVLVCGGLHSDQLAWSAGIEDSMRLVPFRGEYFTLGPRLAARVHGLIYPVPDPRYPFLGVHLTRDVHDQVHVGPNAVLALAYEGYRRRDFAPREMREFLGWPGFRRLAASHWRSGLSELGSSLSRRVYADRIRRYLPDVGASDLLPAPSGVRAQAVSRDGRLIDDFVVTRRGRVLAVRNAPSPAATSSLALARLLVDSLLADE